MNGAVSVAELLGSTLLYQATVRVLTRMQGGDATEQLSADDQMALDLMDRAEVLNGE